MRAHHVRGAADKTPGKLGQSQVAVELEGQSHQRLGTTTVLLGLVKISSNLERDCNLRRQRTSATNLLLRDACPIQPVHHAEHTQNFALSIEQGNTQ